MTDFELMILSDKLGDCIAFVSRIHRAVFWTAESVQKFQEKAPGWTVKCWADIAARYNLSARGRFPVSRLPREKGD